MLQKFWSSCAYRAFSKSSVWRNIEKAKAPETPPTSSSNQVLDMSMSFAPSEFDKKILLLSGKFKSREEIPSRVRYETMDYAKSRLRIKIANILMIGTVLTCVGVIFIGKKRRREGDTILKRITDREEQIREEARKAQQQ